MKLCHIVAHVDEEASGPSYSVPRLAESLADLGNEAVLATLDRGRGSRLLAGVEHLAFPQGRWPRKLGVSGEMRRWLLGHAGDFDVLHSHGLWMMPNVYPARAAMRAAVPFVVSPRGTLSGAAMCYSSRVKALFWRLAQKSALAKATAFHATSADERDDIRRAGFRQPVAIIPNGIDISPVRKTSERAGPRTLLYLGRVHPKKGLDIAIPEWASVQAEFPQWRFRIIGKGDPSHIEALRALAGEAGAERIDFEGPLYGEAKSAALAGADLFILPTRNENFGMVVAEALAHGTPVLTTRGAPWEGLLRRECGWWSKVDGDALGASLREALSQPQETLDAMGKRGRQWMEDDYSWAAIAAHMAEFYAWLIEGGVAPPSVDVAGLETASRNGRKIAFRKGAVAGAGN